ncbi:MULTISPECIES: peptidoglycan-binding domain-containing protein [unclassified Inquilinus]|uniref:peptidoglycan-binding domain-containing protein n=1 Tax=unclassified Inquilinus TaxID=2645927 RepID=UPI003F8F961F
MKRIVSMAVLCSSILFASMHGTAVAGNAVGLQMQLYVLGFDPGRIDGAFGSSTRRALRAYQKDRGLPVTGERDQPTIDKLVSWERAEAQKRDIEITEPMKDGVQEAIGKELIDPYSAVYEYERAYHYPDKYGATGTAICGTVNAKNRYGAYVGRQYFMAALLAIGDKYMAFPFIDKDDYPLAENSCEMRRWYTPSDDKK